MSALIVLLVRALLTLLFCLLIAGAYGVSLKKNIFEALPQAFFWQIIILLFTSICFSSFSFGIILGIIISLGMIAFVIVKEKSVRSVVDFFKPSSNNIEVVLFILAYIVIYVCNQGKTFHHSDEYAHWGVFVKEILRLDRLYCTSGANMAHKDYVPALSLFEALWCKLSLRYKEAETYRAIRMFVASLVMPLLTIGIDRNQKAGKLILKLIPRIVIVFGIPAFITNYYTILPDFAMGILAYYCMYLILTSHKYEDTCIALLPACIVLVLTKMTGAVFIPMILLFWAVYAVKFLKMPWKKVVGVTVILGALPMTVWKLVNVYIAHFVTNKGIQSYDNISGSRIMNAFVFPDGEEWRFSVAKDYLIALFTKETLKNIAFIPFVIVIVVIVCFIISIRTDKNERDKAKLSLMWILIASGAYALFMYMMYMMMFTSYEASVLAAYYRYMSTFLILVAYLAILLLFQSANDKGKVCVAVIAGIVVENIVLFFGVADYMPGVNDDSIWRWESEAQAINDNVGEDEKVYLVVCGDNPLTYQVINYQCVPRFIKWGSPGKARDEDDLWSRDMSATEFKKLIQEYDYVYFLSIDDQFMTEYADVFCNSDVIADHVLYKINQEQNNLVLERR